jgi:predicted dehydrogenase
MSFLAKKLAGLDAVAVLTPTPTHYEIVSKALEKGFNVICEKSLTLSSHEAENLKKAQKDNKSFLSVTHNYTGYPMLRELRRLIENADLGKINQIKIEMPLETYLNQESEKSQPVPQEWRLKDYNVSSISLDLASHIYNLINFLSGEKAEELIAVENTFGRFNQVVDDVNCICKFTNNLLCNIWFSKSAIGHRNGLRIRVYGSKGLSGMVPDGT